MYSSIRSLLSYLLPVLLLNIVSGCGKSTVHREQIPKEQCVTQRVAESIAPRAVELQTIYGTFSIHEPVLLDLLASKAMQRLKKINQHGINDVVKPEWAFSRWDHSVGVFILTRMFGGSLEEQVAALLHDVSHTVFSHVGDLVFAAQTEIEGAHAYQDDIHEWYIEQTDLAPILRKYGMRHVVTDEAKNKFRRLEQEFPDICADRLDYQLRTAYIVGLLKLEEVHEILKHLHFEDGLWFFDAIQQAVDFGTASELLTRYIYAAPYNHYLYKVAADAFRRAMEIGLVTPHELHFSTDDIVWDRMQQSEDPVLGDLLLRIENYETAFELSDESDFDLFKKSKCRVVNPLVKVEGELVRLSEVDTVFAESYAAIQRFCGDGLYLKFRAIEG